MIERIKNEPVIVKELAVAALAVCVAFGLDLSPERTTAIVVLVSAVMALFVRGQVSPVK